jgi:predicted Zn-dependent peptidase
MNQNSTYQLTTLDNGLRIATEKLVGVESVTFCVSFNVGARHEEPEEHGIAHMLEHMAFKGTTKRSARQIAEEFDNIGGQVNAYTSMEQTVYYARVLKQHLPVAVEILGDILQHSLFDAKELAREQDVILQEIGMNEDSPEDLVFDYLHEVAYADQPLGRSILGTPESVKSFSADHLNAYMAKHYHTPAMVISAAGNVEHADVLTLVNEHFSHFAHAALPVAATANYQNGEKRVVRDLEQLQVMLGFHSFPIHDPDYYAVQLLSTILGGGMSSRLFQEIREKRGLAYTVQSFLTTYQDTGMLGLYVATGEDKAAELLPVLVEQVLQLTKSVTEAELTRAKNQHRAGVLMRRESATSVAEWIARHLQDYREYRTAEVLIARAAEVTCADIQRVATRLFSTPKLTLSSLGPQGNLADMNALQKLF